MHLSEEDVHRVTKRSVLIDDPESVTSNDSHYRPCISIDHGPQNQLRVWRKPDPTGVNQYLVVGRAPVPAHVMYNVLLDGDYHTTWDHHCAELRTVKTYSKSENFLHDVNYWVVKYALLIFFYMLR